VTPAATLPILWRTGLRDLMRHPWQGALSILGIALGVAVVVAVDIANDSAQRAFELSIERISGRATHQIIAASGRLPDRTFTEMAGVLADVDAAPVIEATLRIGPATLTLLGTDPLALPRFNPGGAVSVDLAVTDLMTEPGALVLAPSDAERLGLELGDALAIEVNGETRVGRLAGTAAPAPDSAGPGLDGLALADIAAAQEITGRVGWIDRIDLAVDPETAAAIASRLPPGLRLVTASSRSESMRQMTRAFRVNLMAMGLLALLVGAFIVYNTMTFAVLRRRQLLGSLRTLGCTREELFRLVLVEALVLALIGSALGIALGILTGSGLVHLVTRTISDLYFAVTVSGLHLSPLTLSKGIGLGLFVTLLAALGPALEASRAQPRDLLRTGSLERKGHRWVLLLAGAGAGLLVLGWGLAQVPSRSMGLGFVALFLVILGFSLCVPGLLRTIAAAVARLAAGRRPRSLPLLLAARGVETSITRTGLAAAALTVAVASSVGVGIMIESFRSSLVAWLETTLQSDIYISAPNDSSDRPGGGLPPGLAERIAALPGIAALSQGRQARVSARDGEVNLLALHSSSQSRRGFRLEGRVPSDLWERFDRGQVVLASEPFVYHRGLAVGDRISLFTSAGWHDFTLGAVFRDYGSDRGTLVIDGDTYRTLWGDPTVSTLGIVIEPGADPTEVRSAVRDQVEASGETLLVTASGEIRTQSLEIFDRTFAVTHVLRLLAIGVAFVGVLSALLALQLQQGRDHAVLRATGMTSRELAHQVLAQTSLIGLTAGLLAIPLGTMLGALLIRVVNLRSFGWSMDLHLPWDTLAIGVAVAWLAALLAGVYPALAAARAHPARALRAE
jgi:putative ABC transport system permease protein